MKTLRDRLSQSSQNHEAGFSLIEVMVAMMVFAIISIGVVYTLLSAFSLTNEARSREVAANLASQEIDLDRSTGNIFTLLTAAPRTVTVPASGGIRYTITRTVSWVDNSGSDVNCGTETGTLQYKRIHVEVSWPGMIGAPLSVDTLLAPTSVVSAATLGTIIVSAKTSTGSGAAGVAISISPSPGSAAPVTDATGCSYVLNVPPGTYTVTASEAGYIDPTETTTPSHTITVVAGSSSSAGFSIDKVSNVGVTYKTSVPSLNPKFPTNLTASFNTTAGNYVTPATTPTTVGLYPATYTAMAGSYLSAADVTGGCISPDPGAWPAGTSGGNSVASLPPVIVALTPGVPGTVSLPMGAVTVKNTAGFSSNAYITATTTTPVSGLGDPGCPKTMSYTFGAVMPKAANSTVTLALPYGTWKLKMGTSSAPTTLVTTAQMSVPTGSTGTTVSTGSIVTLDPRVVTP